MRHTADPKSYLGYICDIISRMEPNERCSVSMYELHSEIPSFFHNDVRFTAADRVLENIIGSGYTHSYYVDELSQTVTFVRHEDTGERKYTSPDHLKRIKNEKNF